MKTPIPCPNPLDSRVANLERLVAALVDLASPEQLRKAIAATNSRTALADLAKMVAAGALVANVPQVGDDSIAVQFHEMRGGEVVTPSLVIQLNALTAEDRAAFQGKAVGDVVTEVGDAKSVLDQVWNRVAPARMHRPPRWKGRRHGRR